MLWGMPKSAFWLTIALALVLFVPTVTDMPDKARCCWALVAWVALAASAFFLIKYSDIPWARSWLRLPASSGASMIVAILAFLFIRPQWIKAFPQWHDNGDQTSRIERKLEILPDSTYRQLVASVIFASDPHATVSVGALVHTPDGMRTVDVEVRSLDKNSNPLFIAIDVLDLPFGHKADIASIDAADSKRNDIKADVMLVCSNTGFEEDAISKARRKQIGLISVLHQGDKRVKAVIEEEIYLRKIDLGELHLSFNRAIPDNVGFQPNQLLYKGKPVYRWLEKQAALAAASQQTDETRFLQFNFLEPTIFDVLDRTTISLRSMSISFTPHVSWLRQTIQIDATTGIYDWLRGRVSLGPGINTVTLNGINFDTAIPMSSPPVVGGLTGLRPGEIDFSLTDVRVDFTSESEIPNLDSLVNQKDLDRVWKAPEP